MASRGGGGIPTPAAPRAEPGGTGLNRAISKKMLLVFIVGDILGGGIYALAGTVGAEVGGAIWVAFTVALLLAAFTAASYAELTTKYPRAGGAGLFVNRAFGNPLLSFLVAFAVMASGITSAATLSRAFGGDYLSVFIDVEVLVGATALLLIIGVINFIGIKESVRLNLGFTAIEVGGLILITIIGLGVLFDGGGDTSRAFEFDTAEGKTAIAAILGGTALSFYALIGFEDSANVAEEVRDPFGSYPFAIFGGLLIAGVVYLVVTIVASMVVPTDDLAASSGPLLEVNQGPLEINEKVFSAIGLLALSNGALINLIMASRLLYGMAEEKVMPRPLDYVHPTRRTPLVAIVLVTALAIGLAATGDLADLASTTVLLLLAVFIVVNISVLVLKKDTVDHDHFSVPTIVPIIGALGAAVILTQPDAETYTRAGLIMLLGIIVFIPSYLLTRRENQRS
ncbi:MAG: APC family permease [Actinomycetota bacterium]|nr:APC family permease [Actinomycetota bacterium]